MKEIGIVVTFQFEGIHWWLDAPSEVYYLRYPHRHMFHVRAAKEVPHTDRAIEIILFKKELLTYCNNMFAKSNLSCEHMAGMLVDVFGLRECTILEDGENGGYVLDVGEPQVTITKLGNRFNKCFVGIECEGPPDIRGKPTLFMPGNIGWFEYSDAIHSSTVKGHNVYYGADGICEGHNIEIIRDLSEWSKLNNLQVIVEFETVPDWLTLEVLDHLSYSILWVVRTPIDGFSSERFIDHRLFIKMIAEDYIWWVPIPPDGEIYGTPVNDPEFANDKELVITKE